MTAVAQQRARGQARPLFQRTIVQRAIVDAFRKLDPRHQLRNPVMFVVEVGSVLTTGLFLQALFGHGEAPAGFIFAVSAWLWFTVVFANFAEAMAEGRGKAQAESLRKARKDVKAKKLADARRDANPTLVDASQLRKGEAPARGTGARGIAGANRSGQRRSVGITRPTCPPRLAIRSV